MRKTTDQLFKEIEKLNKIIAAHEKNGLLFRIGFTPIIFSDKFLPFIGLSLGYSF